MRIAAKRLRYALEIFAPALDPDADACMKIVKEFQEIAGAIHDDDVFVDVVREQLAHRATDVAGALADLATGNVADIEAFKRTARAAATDATWVDEQVALAAMIARTVHERRERFAHLQAKWAEWRAAGLRERLEALTVDLPADVTPAPGAPAPMDDAPTVAPGLAASPDVDGSHGSKRNGSPRGLIRGALRRQAKRRS